MNKPKIGFSFHMPSIDWKELQQKLDEAETDRKAEAEKERRRTDPLGLMPLFVTPIATLGNFLRFALSDFFYVLSEGFSAIASWLKP